MRYVFIAVVGLLIAIPIGFLLRNLINLLVYPEYKQDKTKSNKKKNV